MTREIIAACLFVYGTGAAFLINRMPTWNMSPVTRAVSPFVQIGGAIGILFAVYFFINGLGLFNGLLTWLVISAVSLAVLKGLSSVFEGLMSISGLLAILAAIALLGSKLL